MMARVMLAIAWCAAIGYGNPAYAEDHPLPGSQAASKSPGGAVASTLASLLAGGSPQAAAAAEKAIRTLGAAALPAVTEILGDERMSRQARERAAGLVWSIESAKGIAEQLHTISDARTAGLSESAVIEELAAIGPPALPALVTVSIYPGLKAKIVAAVGQIPRSSAVPFLSQCALDDTRGLAAQLACAVILKRLHPDAYKAIDVKFKVMTSGQLSYEFRWELDEFEEKDGCQKKSAGEWSRAALIPLDKDRLERERLAIKNSEKWELKEYTIQDRKDPRQDKVVKLDTVVYSRGANEYWKSISEYHADLMRSIRCLSSSADEAAVKTLEALLLRGAKENPQVDLLTVYAIARSSPEEAGTFFSGMLSDRDAKNRCLALLGMSYVHGSDATEAIAARLEDPEGSVRKCAIEALQVRPYFDKKAKVSELLTDSSCLVVAEGLRSLQGRFLKPDFARKLELQTLEVRIGQEVGADAELTDTLEQVVDNSRCVDEAALAMTALPDAVESLAASGDRFGKQRLQALFLHKDASIVDAQRAGAAIIKLDQEEALEFFKGGLSDESSTIQLRSLRALASLPGETAAGVIAEAFSDAPAIRQHASVTRDAAVSVLQRRPYLESRERLLKLLPGRDCQVRKFALEVLIYPDGTDANGGPRMRVDPARDKEIKELLSDIGGDKMCTKEAELASVLMKSMSVP